MRIMWLLISLLLPPRKTQTPDNWLLNTFPCLSLSLPSVTTNQSPTHIYVCTQKLSLNSNILLTCYTFFFAFHRSLRIKEVSWRDKILHSSSLYQHYCYFCHICVHLSHDWYANVWVLLCQWMRDDGDAFSTSTPKHFLQSQSRLMFMEMRHTVLDRRTLMLWLELGKCCSFLYPISLYFYLFD
jgi:hypothetical protein